MIRHTVVFKLKHPAGSAEEKAFFREATRLADISTVKRFECLRQVSQKNPYRFGVSMEFDNQADYETYNRDPDHVKFVENRWMNEVTDFMEIDYEILDQV